MPIQLVKALQSCERRLAIPELFWRVAMLSCLALLFSLAAACGSAGSGVPAPGEPAVSDDAAAPTIKLVTPATGSIIEGPGVPIEVDIDGFIIDPEAVGGARAPGRGHWHLYLDGSFLVAATDLQHTLNQVPPGPHHLRVSLANNDHSPLNPPVEDTLVIEVRGSSAMSGGADAPSYH